MQEYLPCLPCPFSPSRNYYRDGRPLLTVKSAKDIGITNLQLSLHISTIVGKAHAHSGLAGAAVDSRGLHDLACRRAQISCPSLSGERSQDSDFS